MSNFGKKFLKEVYMSENYKIRVGITHGDPNGIGYEVILKALEDNRMSDLCTPILYGSGKLVAHYRKLLGLQQIQFQTMQDAEEDIKDGHYGLINVIGENFHVEPGTESPEAGAAALAALDRAVTDLLDDKIDVLVTAPINKHSIQSDDFRFAGHTEYLAQRSGDAGNELMILTSDRIRVALVTTHISVNEIAPHLSVENILRKTELLNKSLKEDFGIVCPRIAVLSLNPHAGDSGVIGEEEKEIIRPAIEKAREKNIQAFGPYAADGFFGNGLYKKFDATLAMYHDQGLIPFKTIAMDSGVNFTAGLGFVRTSPDHGTAFDIAGQNLASEESFRNAIYEAIDIFRNRERYEEMTSNPLKKQYFNKGKDNVVLDLSE